MCVNLAMSTFSTVVQKLSRAPVSLFSALPIQASRKTTGPPNGIRSRAVHMTDDELGRVITAERRIPYPILSWRLLVRSMRLFALCCSVFLFVEIQDDA